MIKKVVQESIHEDSSYICKIVTCNINIFDGRENSPKTKSFEKSTYLPEIRTIPASGSTTTLSTPVNSLHRLIVAPPGLILSSEEVKKVKEKMFMVLRRKKRMKKKKMKRG